ncbi:hypothetical protein AB1Y20_009494 [Prymnesium parvum]|uniref:Uncharacterized protein n=1 Tax=Prymnesium parvum TaxID=97485 RepID=A0AB34K5X4_PRYPA|eukprot:CAMPEP_0182806084 /NCGR_PEP_ID=MMETSP0006_2-20121128/5407_1 /TAXON_ID=97485 /ORGANISM="Prymnesium parvum, Strain Texoma1" /LENGTH=174 /DNA_ID=CAMNT_0024931669 /DNA_START=63 /DNA_END=587 /DNA_ORIENTATION=+
MSGVCHSEAGEHALSMRALLARGVKRAHVAEEHPCDPSSHTCVRDEANQLKRRCTGSAVEAYEADHFARTSESFSDLSSMSMKSDRTQEMPLNVSAGLKLKLMRLRKLQLLLARPPPEALKTTSAVAAPGSEHAQPDVSDMRDASVDVVAEQQHECMSILALCTSSKTLRPVAM